MKNREYLSYLFLGVFTGLIVLLIFLNINKNYLDEEKYIIQMLTNPINTEMSYEEIGNTISLKEDSFRGYAFITDLDGIIIYHINEDVVGENIFNLLPISYDDARIYKQELSGGEVVDVYIFEYKYQGNKKKLFLYRYKPNEIIAFSMDIIK